MQEHGYRVPSQAEDEPWTCPLCLSSTAPTALLLSQRDASTRRARHPVVSHTACRAGDEGPPRKKRKHVKRDGALLQPAPLQPAPTRLRRPKGWAVQLLTSLEMQAWPTEAELGPLPTRLPSAFTLASDSASGSGWCVLAPTADYFSRFGVPSDEHAQATRLLNNAIKATHLLNTAGLDGPRFHRPPGRTGLGKAKPFYRLSPAALLVLSSSAAKIRRAAESQQQLSVLQIAKKHARLAAAPQDLFGAGFDHCPVCEMPVLSLDDPWYDEKCAAIAATVSSTSEPPAACSCSEPTQQRCSRHQAHTR